MAQVTICDSCGNVVEAIQWPEYTESGALWDWRATPLIRFKQEGRSVESVEEYDMCWICFDKLRKTTTNLVEPKHMGGQPAPDA